MLSFICVHENFVNFVREHVLPAKGDDFMELKPIGVSNRLFYYLNGGENSAFDACFRFDFKEETQEELLSAAIAKALQSFPEFAFRPVLHEGTVWAAKNEAPVPLLHEEAAPLCYGTEETNGYIFAFRALYGRDHDRIGRIKVMQDKVCKKDPLFPLRDLAYKKGGCLPAILRIRERYVKPICFSHRLHSAQFPIHDTKVTFGIQMRICQILDRR